MCIDHRTESLQFGSELTTLSHEENIPEGPFVQVCTLLLCVCLYMCLSRVFCYHVSVCTCVCFMFFVTMCPSVCVFVSYFVTVCICVCLMYLITVSVHTYVCLILQGMPSDQLRSHLVMMSQALTQAVQLISKEKITVRKLTSLYLQHNCAAHHCRQSTAKIRLGW